MRIALIESTHWHTPLYLDALRRDGRRIVAISDSVGGSGKPLAEEFGANLYTGHTALLDNEPIDFAFVFGRHADMPGLARDLLARGVPFAIEKPCGIDAATVSALADEAERRNVYVSVPFIFRVSDTLRIIRESESRPDVTLHHASFRFIAGPPQRYINAGTQWMLDPSVSGGGALMNVGVHFIDLFRTLAGEDISSVSALATSAINGLPIEDFISVRLATRSGRICTLECGYTFPSDPARQREFTVSVRTADNFYLSEGDSLLVRSGFGPTLATRSEPVRFETDVYYADFVDRTLAEVASGQAPLAGLRDAAHAVRAVEAAYESARRGGETIALGG